MQKDHINIKHLFFLILYYCFFRYFPKSGSRFFGPLSKKMRYCCCKNIFKFCGKNVNIERLASFGNGLYIEIGDNSGIGVNCIIPNNTIIGKNVKMGPNVVIIPKNHEYLRSDIPIDDQGYQDIKITIIEDDVWIGRSVIFTPGRHVSEGCVIGAGTVLSKDFEKYSVIAGNPPRVIKKRK